MTEGLYDVLFVRIRVFHMSHVVFRRESRAPSYMESAWTTSPSSWCCWCATRTKLGVRGRCFDVQFVVSVFFIWRFIINIIPVRGTWWDRVRQLTTDHLTSLYGQFFLTVVDIIFESPASQPLNCDHTRYLMPVACVWGIVFVSKRTFSLFCRRKYVLAWMKVPFTVVSSGWCTKL